ncbi:uncharacterized protein LOC129596752 [Paramacrobiotus metropolitanus]|uniref:uncharacterized protein LOC129596752 n=1 Tax=Paramacrobiotus metropolitanus TaxID=2943436 RepID=UPI002445605B|nr:uncharacterized protein LOC129596752 [Paramacrobiotus metropolitanus]
MFAYANETRYAQRWNAVDVLVDGGELVHGEVINMVQGGLIIDFQCAEHRAQFVEYGSIFHCDKNFKRDGEDAEILLRRHPDGAWIWYPGRFLEYPLRHSYRDAEFVEVQRPQGITIRELVPLEQVRAPSSKADLEERRVGDQHFVVRCYPWSAEDFADGDLRWRETFLYVMQRECHVICTSVCSQRLIRFYLELQKDQPLDAQRVKGVYYETKKLEREDSLLGTWQWIVRHVTVGAFNAKTQTPDRDGVVGLSLPPELLVEIFQSLDSIERIRCRRVCSLWNILLSTPAYFRDVRVSGNVTHYGKKLHFYMEHINRIYWIVACFVKFVNSSTQRIVLADLDAIQCTEVTGLIKKLAKTTPIPPLIFYGCSFGYAKFLIQDIITGVARILARLSKCGGVVWRKCSLHDHNVRSAIAHHAFGDLASKPQLRLLLWELFENNLVLTKPIDRAALAEWIAECIAQQRTKELEDQIVKGLHRYQSVDLRSAAHYRNRNWTASTVSQLDVNLLTTLTVAALSEGVDPIPDWRLRAVGGGCPYSTQFDIDHLGFCYH